MKNMKGRKKGRKREKGWRKERTERKVKQGE